MEVSMSAILLAICAVFAAQAQQQLSPLFSSTCAAMYCGPGTTCKEVYDTVTGRVQPQCLENVRPTGNEHLCGASSQPLYVNSSAQGVAEAFCGLSPFPFRCPTGYLCNVHPTDAYAVCCRGPLTKPGECPAISPEVVPGPSNCGFACTADIMCPGSEKCCSTACGGLFCQSPATSVVPSPPTRPSCLTVKCSAGYHCQMVRPTDCVRRVPCFDAPRCVPIKRGGGERRLARSAADPRCPTLHTSVRLLACYPHDSCHSCKPDEICCNTACGGRHCALPKQ